MAVLPRYSGTNSDIGSVSGFQPSTRSLSPAYISRSLRGRFKFYSAGRNSCGTLDSGTNHWLYRSPEGKNFFTDSHHCHSISSCPSCRARRLSRRASEIQSVIDLFLSGVDSDRSSNRQVFLLTLTVPHYQRDSLSNLLGKTKISGLRAARSYFFSQSRFRHFPGFRGWICGIEVQLGGKNGFHPHIHALIFLEDSDPEKFRAQALSYWKRACTKFGLRAPSDANGIDFRPGDNAADYLSKWSGGAELSDFGAKISDSSFSPAQAERAILEGFDDLQPKLQEYYNNFYGVKIHTFSAYCRYLRRMHLKNRISVHFAQVIGQFKSAESISDINAIGFDQIADFEPSEISDLFPDFQPDQSSFFNLSDNFLRAQLAAPDISLINRLSAVYRYISPDNLVKRTGVSKMFDQGNSIDFLNIISAAILGHEWAQSRLYQAIDQFYPDSGFLISDFDQSELLDILRAYSE